MKTLIFSIITATSLSHAIAQPLTMSDAIVLQQLNSQYQQQPQQSSSSSSQDPHRNLSEEEYLRKSVAYYKNIVRQLEQENKRLKADIFYLQQQQRSR
jgi:HPt (histidine-containing phosphotransfer) domain-containing protein